jgi:small nuclear ribonucleoprotein (snRNP)-like protein
MKFEQEKEFKPLTITIETKEEYIALMHIVDEAVNVHMDDTVYMQKEDYGLANELSNYFSNDV